MRALTLIAVLVLAGVAAASRVERARVRNTGEWCGCVAGPKGCSRPCTGCCGGDEGMCFSGMDPGARGGCHARDAAR